MTKPTSMLLSTYPAQAAWNAASRVENRVSGIFAKRHFFTPAGLFSDD
jgi:hypothetical protein